MSAKEAITLDMVANLAKRRGFLYPGSEIYGGLAGVYDYGPMGVRLKHNITEAWRASMLFDHDNIVEIDSAIMMHPSVWEASGHVGGFSDPLVEHKPTNARLRVDHLLEDIGVEADEKMTDKELQKLFDEHFDDLKLPSHKKSEYGKVRSFNLLVQSNFGATSSSLDNPVYLRGETAQGIFVNMKQVLDTSTVRVPFGIAQIGKAFRNEINPRQFVFRMREFEQMEMQYFVHPDEAEKAFETWKEERMRFYIEKMGIDANKLRLRQHENLVFYAQDAWDIEYEFDFGWKEIEGIHWRGDYDVSQHMEASGKDLRYTDPHTAEKYIPHVVETSAGVDRLTFMALHHAYRSESIDEKERLVLGLHPALAPVKMAVSPLVKNKPELVAKAREIYELLRGVFGHVAWDDHGNIGKRYRRQDEIGTPLCIVVDFDSLEDGTVSVRHRDTLEQERVSFEGLVSFIQTFYG